MENSYTTDVVFASTRHVSLSIFYDSYASNGANPRSISPEKIASPSGVNYTDSKVVTSNCTGDYEIAFLSLDT